MPCVLCNDCSFCTVDVASLSNPLKKLGYTTKDTESVSGMPWQRRVELQPGRAALHAADPLQLHIPQAEASFTNTDTNVEYCQFLYNRCGII